jgi:HAD superfamily hydrolase (TIGR01484 family)
MYKLIAVDMDDTLLDNSIQISPRTREVLQKSVAQGVKVTIATGRMYCSALPFARQLGLNVPLITYNGALIKNSLSGEILLHHPVDSNLALEVLAFFKAHDWYIQSYVDDVLYVDKNTATIWSAAQYQFI